jgi:hypothetical protein
VLWKFPYFTGNSRKHILNLTYTCLLCITVTSQTHHPIGTNTSLASNLQSDFNFKWIWWILILRPHVSYRMKIWNYGKSKNSSDRLKYCIQNPRCGLLILHLNICQICVVVYINFISACVLCMQSTSYIVDSMLNYDKTFLLFSIEISLNTWELDDLPLDSPYLYRNRPIITNFWNLNINNPLTAPWDCCILHICTA